MVTAVAAIFAFATIVTLGLPMLDRNQLGAPHEGRVASAARNCAPRHHAALNAKRGSLRSEPVSLHESDASSASSWRNMLESEGTRDKLAQAG